VARCVQRVSERSPSPGATCPYARHGLEPSPTDPLNLQMLIKDIRLAVDEA
jgi:hypothetical protein